MSTTIYLYLKTHNTTGLQYLGKTIKDPFAYKGSGVYWKSHLKKHGNDVTTEILFETTDKDAFEKVSLEYSTKFDIVNNKTFANLIEERGQGGITTNQWKKGSTPWNKGKVGSQPPWTEERKNAQSERAKRLHRDLGHVEGGKRAQYIKKGPARIDNTSSLNTIILTCPHCGKEGNLGNMKRWHFDNCKVKDV
jgi:hypothetical protein